MIRRFVLLKFIVLLSWVALQGLQAQTNPGVLISEVYVNPPGTDFDSEFVALLALRPINFSVTPYTVIVSNNGAANASGWVQGGSVTYAFEITSGTVSPGEVFYVGGANMKISNTAKKLRLKFVGQPGDGSIGNNMPNGGVIGNGGTNSDGVAVFNLPVSSITSSTVPVDAILFGTGHGGAVVSGGTQGYQLPVNDRYIGGKLKSGIVTGNGPNDTSTTTATYLAPDPGTAGSYIRATAGTFDTLLNKFTVRRSWAATLTPHTENATNISIVGAPVTPTISLNTNSLNFPKYTRVGDVSDSIYFVINANNLTSNVIIKSNSDEFILRRASASNYDTVITITGVTSLTNDTIFVLFAPLTYGTRNTIITVSSTGATTQTVSTTALGMEAENTIVANKNNTTIRYITSYDTEEGVGAAEIIAYDSATKRLFLVSNPTNSSYLEILDISNPSNPTHLLSIDMEQYGLAVNSVAVKNGIVATAVEDSTRTNPGKVVFFDINGNYLHQVQVGVQPDMLTFTPDGTKVLTADEGEPNSNYTIDPEGSVSIITIPGGNIANITSATVQVLKFTDFDSSGSRFHELPKDFRASSAGKGSKISQDIEPEYITISDDGTKAFVALQENNAIARIDIPTARIDTIFSLGYKNFPAGGGLDASDRDSANTTSIRIRNYPVWGAYQPDGIHYVVIGGKGYVLSANEGEMREYPENCSTCSFVDFARVNTFTAAQLRSRYDSVAGQLSFDSLRTNEQLGRLRIDTVIARKPDGTPFRQIVTFGARSFSLWDAQTGQLAYDSKSEFELITSQETPHRFNGDRKATGNLFDTRSDDKGPEPEYVVAGKIGNKTYAFIGLERIGGFMMYDITNIDKIKYVAYVPNAAIDDSPEGMLFIPASQSPNGKDLLLLANETSGTVSFYQIEQNPSQVQNFTATPLSPKRLKLSWDDTIGINRFFEIMRNSQRIALLPSSARSYIDTTTGGFSYTYQIRAYVDTNSTSQNTSLTVTMPTTTTLQLLHSSDMEAGVAAVQNAPRWAAIIDALEDSFPNTLILSSGDNYIPGPWFAASEDRSASSPIEGVIRQIYNQYFGLSSNTLRTASARPDITILNITGFDASALGNHEFDAGTETAARAIGVIISETDRQWAGTQFPYLSANLNFKDDDFFRNIYTDSLLPNTAYRTRPDTLTQTTPTATTPVSKYKKVAPYTVVERNGELFGIVGATTQIVETISSTGGVRVKGPKTNNMQALADTLQPYIDTLINRGINKIILLSHLQQIELEQDLIKKLRGVDIVVAGGSHAILADGNDIIRSGDSVKGKYPIITTNLDGDTALIVNTDGEYKYVGRLVVTFSSNGKIMTNSLDSTINGAYASLDTVVSLVWNGDTALAFAANTKGEMVRRLANAINTVIQAQDGNIFGKTSVFLEGRRSKVRTEETNLGNLTAEANLWAARRVDSNVRVSIKNGGGIRSHIGDVVVVGSVSQQLPPKANPSAGKQAGDISQLDIVNSLRFNNVLVLQTLTAAQLYRALEHGFGDSDTLLQKTPGRFPQLAGVKVSFDARRPVGDRVRSILLVDSAGNVTDVIRQNGIMVGDTNRPIRIVTLNFLATGGDGYPFQTFRNANPTFANYQTVKTGSILNQANFAGDSTEQDAFAEYLKAFFSTTAYNTPETSISQDQRIQNLVFRADSLIVIPFAPTNMIATGIDTNKVALTWSGAIRTDSVVIERRLWGSSGSFSLVATIAGSAVTFTDSSALVPNTAYEYRLRVRNKFSDLVATYNVPQSISNLDSAKTLPTHSVITSAYSSESFVIEIYPNPVVDLLNISAEEGVAFLFNLQGQLVWSGKVNKNTVVSLANLASGVYVLQISTPAGTEIRKIVKQ
ncbi:MAG: choice-of-anchor I family protein [Cytophagales bacterium]|nr:choice-of-anchor I family protein [Cytophagales bacterium]MDW8384324.1 choice-of-anchor I family protein [Flammeovirgaceae bacterium]